MKTQKEKDTEALVREYVRDYMKNSVLLERRIKRNMKLLLEKANVEDTINPSTGINVLEGLLKQIVPTLEKSYKSLTTSQEQRDSFRAHIANAVQKTLQTLDVNASAVESGSLKELDVGVGPDTTGDDKFIDITGGKKKPDPEEEVDNFSIPGQDITGRNMALDVYDKVEKQIADSYQLLSSDEDRQVFKDYLLANVKLYFDKFESELSTTISEPTNPEYEREADKINFQDQSPEL